MSTSAVGARSWLLAGEKVSAGRASTVVVSPVSRMHGRRSVGRERENGAGDDAGLVLGGGGARGAYASGALSVLLPELKDQVSVIVGTSAGALIAGIWRPIGIVRR